VGKAKYAKSIKNDVYPDGFNYNRGSCNVHCNSVIYLYNDTCTCVYYSKWLQIDAADF
jgi:hypothetical protein